MRTREAIEKFVAGATRPVALEPGDDPLPVAPGHWDLREDSGRLLLQVWTETRNLVRRVTGVTTDAPGQLTLSIEKFGKRTGTLQLLDTAKSGAEQRTRRACRLSFREQFRRCILRQFTGWKLVEISCEADLQHSLSPAFPRAFLRRGAAGWAAIGAATPGDADAALTFGLIWLDYLRRREEARVTVEGLVLFVPEGFERTTCHRVRFLDPQAARYRVFVHKDGWEQEVDIADSGNIHTNLPDRSQRPVIPEWIRRLGGELVEAGTEVSLRVRGLEFARWNGTQLRAGIGSARHIVPEFRAAEIRALALEIAQARNEARGDRREALFAAVPERWLETEIRENLPLLDPALQAGPAYSQAPTFSGGERGVIDLLGIGFDGRLAVIEVKAAEDVHLPLQALDYWARVKWHLDQGDFAARGYFPGQQLSPLPPRMLLVAPALHFHPSTETVVRFLTSQCQVERIGLAAGWRRELKVVFRARGSEPAGIRCEDKTEVT